MQRLLARLYDSLGETATATELLRAGLDGVEPADRADALRLAADYDLLSSQLTSADDGADALAAAVVAEILRKRHAPGDPVERMRSRRSR